MARGFRKVVIVYIEDIITSDLKILRLVNCIREMSGTKTCVKSQRFIGWLEEVTQNFEIDDNERLDLISIFIKIIFKTKTTYTFIQKICNYQSERFNFNDLKCRIEKFW